MHSDMHLSYFSLMSTARQNVTRVPQLYTTTECSNLKSTAPCVMFIPTVAKFGKFKSVMNTHTHRRSVNRLTLGSLTL
jgi:hypothetical protein